MILNSIQGFIKKSIIFPIFCISCNTFSIEPFQATYQVIYNDKPFGTATSSLQKINNEWNYNFSATAGDFINASAQSIFQFNNENIQSSKYNRNTQFLFFKNQNSIQFDAQKMNITTQDNKKSYQYPLEKNVYDELNIELQIRDDLKHSQLKDEYLVAGTREIKSLQLIQEGSEEINTNAGQFQTLKITMKHDDANRETTFWLAPSLDYLPVKALHNDRNFSYIISLNEYKKTNID